MATLDRCVGIGAWLRRPGNAGGYLLSGRGGMLGGRFDGLVQQRRFGSTTTESDRVLERVVVVGPAQPDVAFLNFLNSVTCVASVGLPG